MVTIFDNIDLNDPIYVEADLDSHNFYLIAVTEDKEVKSITFSAAVDSGVTNNPLVIGNVSLDIDNEVSGKLIQGFPLDFYLKPLQIVKKDGTVITEGEFDIEINITEF